MEPKSAAQTLLPISAIPNHHRVTAFLIMLRAPNIIFCQQVLPALPRHQSG
jgi:hypothetical protein